ncbi:MAG TPA: hypothetical protein VGN94_12355, partial [Methylobacterium sp.]|nr:hypothetical protein [Methylobacterium sp.]
MARFRTHSVARRCRALAAALFALVIATLVGTATFTRAADEGEKTVLGGLLSKALSTSSSRVAIGAVDGALSSDATIRDVAISDRDGVWLKLDRARLVWRRLALLSGRLEIDSLELGRLEVLRRPFPAPVTDAPEPDGSLLPDLPVKVEVKGFRLAELVLGEAIAGQPARLDAQGKVKLGAPAEGLDLDLNIRRLDAAGQFVARLLFVPKGERLEVKATLTEPAGGLLSKGLNVPGTPPINLDLEGRGTLDAWNARLDFDAGESIGAKGAAKISRIGAERRLSLDLASRIEGLLPGPAAAVFSGTTQLDGSLRFSDSGSLGIDRLELASRTARLDARGTLNADRVADFTVSARAVPTEGGVTKAAETELQSLVFDGSLKGPLARPEINGSLKAAGLRTRDSSLDRIEASVKAAPVTSEKVSRFALSADARVEGLSLSDPALAHAIGSRAALTLRATLEPDNTLAVSSLRVEGPNAEAAYAGRIGQNTLTGRIEAEMRDLAVYSDLAGRTLSGSLSAEAALSGDPARKAVTADVDLRAQGLGLAHPALDRLLGRNPRFSGRLSQVYDGYGFENARLEGAAMIARLDGRATARLADARLNLDLKDLTALDGKLAGRAAMEGRLTGTLLRPDLTAVLSAPEATALGRPIRNLRVDTTVRDLTGALDGSVRLGGTIGGKSLEGDLQLTRPSAQNWALDRLAIRLGSVGIDGRAAIDAGTGLTDGTLTLTAADLDDLSAIALTPMSGSLDAGIVLTRGGGRQDAAIRAKGAQIRVGEIGLARLDTDLKGQDLLRAPVIDGRLDADRLVAAGESLDTVRVAAVGTPSASDVTLKAKARGFDLDGAARLVPAERTRIELSRFSAARGADRLALVGPATITLGDGGALIDGLGIAAGS